MAKYNFHIYGIHCKACVLMIEGELGDLQNVESVKASLHDHTVEVVGEFGNKTPEQIAGELTASVAKNGYAISVDKQVGRAKWYQFKIAIPIAISFVILFVLLQKAGLVNLVGTGRITYGTIFAIGIIASLSSCMAVVGGLLLSMSATFAKEGNKFTPSIMFHISRIVSFFILGGVIGAIGSAFSLSTTASFILSLIVGLIMLLLGINLLDVFVFTKKLQPSIPKFISKRAMNVSKLRHSLTPMFVGIATFFLPCGFTQSMQLYALSTGSFVSGAMTMVVFALGTLPVLALISFSSLYISSGIQKNKNQKNTGIFFKTAGLIVIAFALFNIINSLVVINVLPPIFNF